MVDNPYAPPKSRVPDATVLEGGFMPAGRGVAAGNGWRWIVDAWSLMAGQRLMFLVVCVLYLLLAIGVQFVPLVGWLAGVLFTPVIGAGFILGCDAVRRGETLEVEHLFAAFRRQLGKLVALGVIAFALRILIAAVAIAVLGAGFALVLFSGDAPSPELLLANWRIILLAALVALALYLPVAMLMWFAGPLIVLNDFDIGPALSKSFQACLKNVVPFLVWSVMVLVLAIPATIPLGLGWLVLGPVLAIPATIPLGLGWLVLGPVLAVSIYTGYRDIFYEP